TAASPIRARPARTRRTRRRPRSTHPHEGSPTGSPLALLGGIPMAKLYETLSTERQLEAAVRVHGPATLAQTFSAFVGQFYDRSEFDALARRVDALSGPDR